MKHTYMAIGAHIGDVELASGLTLATLALQGHKIITVALTGGERGNPKHLTCEEYLVQKKKEAHKFAEMLNGEAIVFDYLDGQLPDDQEVRHKIAQLIREHKPKAIFTHWKNSMHKDHALTSKLVTDASFYAVVDMAGKVTGDKHYAPVYFSENWEDEDEFKPYIYFKGTEEGYELWKKAMQEHWFIMNSPSFKYYNYYTSLAVVRGALARTDYAEGFAVFEYQKKVNRDDF